MAQPQACPRGACCKPWAMVWEQVWVSVRASLAWRYPEPRLLGEVGCPVWEPSQQAEHPFCLKPHPWPRASRLRKCPYHISKVTWVLGRSGPSAGI